MCRILIYGCQAVENVEKQTTDEEMKTIILCRKMTDLREEEFSRIESLHELLFCVKAPVPEVKSESDKPNEEFVEGSVKQEEGCNRIISADNESSSPEAIDDNVQDLEEEEGNFEPAKLRKKRSRRPDSEAPNKCEKILKTCRTNQIHMKLCRRKYTCEPCSRDFVNLEKLKHHMRKHTGKKAFACNICRKSFYIKSQLNAHLRGHTTMKSFVCEVCGKALATKGKRDRHLETHTDVKKNKCVICDKAFFTKGSAKTHMATHAEKRQKKHKCNICDKAFFTKGSAKTHMVIHAKKRQKKHKCNICDKAFFTKGSAKTHMAIHAKKRQKKHKCNICDKAFFTKGSAKTHIALYHTHMKCG